jgi:hypothetical protein
MCWRQPSGSAGSSRLPPWCRPCGRSVGSRQSWPPARSIGWLGRHSGFWLLPAVECAHRTRAHLRPLRDDIGRQDLSCRRVWPFRGAAFALAQPRWAGRIRSIERGHSARRCVRRGHARRVTGGQVSGPIARAGHPSPRAARFGAAGLFGSDVKINASFTHRRRPATANVRQSWQSLNSLWHNGFRHRPTLGNLF